MRTWKGDLGLPQTVFRPPFDMFDVLIHLTPRHIPRHRQAVDPPVTSFSRGLLAELGPSPLMPVLGYDPPQLYLAQLRVSSQRTSWPGAWCVEPRRRFLGPCWTLPASCAF